MNKSKLVAAIAQRQPQLSVADVQLSVDYILSAVSKALANGDRIEVRGFGSFGVRYRKPRTGRNPRTGGVVILNGKNVPHFKPGRVLCQRLNSEDDRDKESDNKAR